MTAAKQFRVFGRTGWRRECPPAPNGGRQTREIVAAKTIASARRLFGCTMAQWRCSGCETGNEEEITQAMSKPGVVFWRPLDARKEEEWQR